MVELAAPSQSLESVTRGTFRGPQFKCNCNTKQRCWAHLLRDIHDLRALYLKDAPLARWAAAVHRLYEEAKAFSHPQAQRRRTAQLALERKAAGHLPALSWLTR